MWDAIEEAVTKLLTGTGTKALWYSDSRIMMEMWFLPSDRHCLYITYNNEFMEFT